MQKLQLSIPEPCHENWQQMTPTEQGRFCNACAKEVVDFSMMTDTEVLNYFTSLTHEKVCGRALPSQLERTITKPKDPKKRLFWYWNYIVMFFMFFGKGNAAKAQGGVKAGTEINPVKANDIRGEIAVVESKRVISGKVTDINANPISFASIKIKGTNSGIMADANGAYSLRVNPNAILVISGAGFIETEVPVGLQLIVNTVMEKNTNAILGGEVVVAYAGGISYRNIDEYYGPIDKSKRVAVIQVKDEITGKVIPNVTIIIKPRSEDFADTAFTDKKGIYKIKGITDYDRYAIRISVEGYEPNEFTIDEYDFKNRKKEWAVLLKKKKDQPARSTAIAKTGSQNIIRMGAVNTLVTKEPLYVVDGTIMAKNTDINPADIDNIEVLQGSAATALFGSDGANGAIVITTKRSKVQDLDTVTVTAYPVVGKLTKITTTCTTSVMGGMVKGQTIRVQDKISDSLRTITTAITGAIKIYPNPVQRNTDFSVALKLKQAGNYSLQVTDVTGIILLQQKFNAVSKDHTEKIMGDGRWAAGIYYIRVFDAQNKLISKSSFIFQ